VLWSLVDRAPRLLQRHSLSGSRSLVCLDGGGSEHLGFVLLVKLHELGQIELGLLQDLGLVDEDVLERVELGALLGDLLADLFREKLSEEVLEGRFLGLVDHDLHHLGTDVLDLRSLGVAGGLDLFVLAASERNREQTDHVAIVGLGLDEGLNKGVPFLDEGAELVASDADTDEVGVAVELLDFLNLELDDSPGVLVLVLLVQVGVGDLENAALEGLRRSFQSSLLVARGQSGHSNLKNGGSADTVPLLVHEWVLCLLLLATGAFLFEVSRVLSGSHVLKFRSDNRRGGLPSY